MGTVLVVLVIGCIAVMGLTGFAGLALFTRDQREIKKLEANPEPVLKALFDGADQVVYAPHDSSGGLTMATLLRGAGEHGYRMVAGTGQSGTRSVVFERTAQG
jgi:hypothetical protein